MVLYRKSFGLNHGNLALGSVSPSARTNHSLFTMLYFSDLILSCTRWFLSPAMQTNVFRPENPLWHLTHLILWYRVQNEKTYRDFLWCCRNDVALCSSTHQWCSTFFHSLKCKIPNLCRLRRLFQFPSKLKNKYLNLAAKFFPVSFEFLTSIAPLEYVNCLAGSIFFRFDIDVDARRKSSLTMSVPVARRFVRFSTVDPD